MPDNARVLLDEANRTYLSPLCAGKETRALAPGHRGRGPKLKYERIRPVRGSGVPPGRPLLERQLYGPYGHAAAPAQPLNQDGTWNW